MKVPVLCVRAAEAMPWLVTGETEDATCNLCSSAVLVAPGTIQLMSYETVEIMLICTRCALVKLQGAK